MLLALYRGIVDQNGSGLSIPGTSSFLLPGGASNPGVNNASAFAETLRGYPQLEQKQLGEADGELYANPKTIYSGVSNAIVNPAYGDFYDYFQYLKSLNPVSSPIRWSGQFNQQTAYRVTDVVLDGFTGQGDFSGYDQNASIHLSLSYDSYTTDNKPPPKLTQTADVVIPWFGIPQTPSLPGINTAAPAANAYTVANSDRDPQQPSGGWTLEWAPAYQNGQTFSGALAPLTPFRGSAEEVSSGGSDQVGGLYSYYDELFAYDKAGITLTPKPYEWNPTGDVLLSFSPPANPQVFDWQSLTLNGAAAEAVLQIKFDGTHWFFQGNSGQLWNNIATGAEFKVPGGGNLPGGFSPTVGLQRAPGAVTALEDLTFKPQSGVSTAAPVTSFQVLDAGNNHARVATLSLEDSWQANQLVNPTNFTYAATTAGILGAGAGYYIRPGTTGNYQTVNGLQNDLYGTVVGDFLSLINAGLLGATKPFTYGAQALPIGELGQLDSGYQIHEGAVVPSPWLDKVNGPVAKDALFGASAWNQPLPTGLEAPYSVWASLVNDYATSVYGFGLSDRFRNGYDISFNLEKMDLSSLSDAQKDAIQL
ncbi:hypothetical protein [Synechococcus sp. CS-1328]|uniref:hypothetical protein n=1 Tax=Synechococcus sp. CS-1328 TaxID=2847976 RepID=UPI00223BABFD|nr:hypothetical protein [Synechococcus sp. CS-1328]MCT0223692.1 hypothetical protein [Synechococcus sp. CS-1328]